MRVCVGRRSIAPAIGWGRRFAVVRAPLPAGAMASYLRGVLTLRTGFLEEIRMKAGLASLGLPIAFAFRIIRQLVAWRLPCRMLCAG